MSLNPVDMSKLTELQQLCDECKDAIESQSAGPLKSAMEDACEKCRSVRHLIPELMALRQQTEIFAGTLKTA
jgi:hypothetical protein